MLTRSVGNSDGCTSIELKTNIGTSVIWIQPDLSNKPAIKTWILSYLLKLLSTDLGIFFIDLIDKNRARYPDIIQQAIRTVIDHTTKAGQVANELGLYLPRSSRMNLEFFFGSLYWLRKFRPERPALERVLYEISHTDLYLMPSNLYEHHPGRKLLSYYDDMELYLKFGRIGERLFPKDYPSKKDQLDGIVAFGLSRYGFIEIERWERPIRLKLYPNGNQLTLDTLLSNREISRMVILRLAIQVHSCFPWLRDPEAWQPLLSLIDLDSHSFYNEYLTSKQRDNDYSSQDYISLPEIDTTPIECLVCRTIRYDNEFSLCGHPICIICQAMIKSSRCPFCTEHFTAEGISDDFIELIRDGPTTNRGLSERILQITKMAQGRLFQFDWANIQIQLFGLKSL